MTDLKKSSRLSQTGEIMLDFQLPEPKEISIRGRRASRSRSKIASVHNSSRRSSQRKQLISSLNENVYQSLTEPSPRFGAGSSKTRIKKNLDPEVEFYKFKKRKSAIDAQIKKIIEPNFAKKSKSRNRSQKKNFSIRTKDYKIGPKRVIHSGPGTPGNLKSTRNYNSTLQGIDLEKYGIRSKRIAQKNFSSGLQPGKTFVKQGSLSARTGEQNFTNRLIQGLPGSIFPIEEREEKVGVRKIIRRTAAAKVGEKGSSKGYRNLYKIKKEKKAMLRKANLKTLAKFHPGPMPTSGPLYH